MDDVELLKRLILAYSPTGKENEAVRYLTGQMTALGMQSRIDEVGNAIGECGPPPESGAKCLLLLGHIDTVPGEIAIRQDNDDIYGRGSVDAKGALAAFVSAVSDWVDQNKLHIVVVGAIGEEGGSVGARHIIEKMNLDNKRPNYAIVGEPGGWQSVTIGYKGKISLRYVITGETAHPASLEKDPVDKCLDFIQDMRVKTNEFKKTTSFESLSMSVGAATPTDKLILPQLMLSSISGHHRDSIPKSC